jgi:hypothetical protein
MWLLDANMDVHVVRLLAEFDVAAESAISRAWETLDNGELVTAAVGAGFTCLLTQDRLFGESAARALKTSPDFAVIVVHLPQKPWREYVTQFRSAWQRSPITPAPGRLAHWPAS